MNNDSPLAEYTHYLLPSKYSLNSYINNIHILIVKYEMRLIKEYEMRFFHSFFAYLTRIVLSASNRHGFFGTILSRHKKATKGQESGVRIGVRKEVKERKKSRGQASSPILHQSVLPIFVTNHF